MRADNERTLATQIELSEIPAPPFQEEARGSRVAELFADAGLVHVSTDRVGNVVAHAALGRTSSPPRPDAEAPFVVSAHLDTVFPEGTDVRVTREGALLRGPGISDDARGLATLIALARACDKGGVRTGAPVLFVATVGEEGPGDLRGVRQLFAEDGAARRARGFVSLDGAGIERIVARGLGSRRFRVAARGPGGHSWMDWGTANPIHVLSGVAERLVALPLPEHPVTTLTIARWGGGKSINAIPQHAWLELDTRSESDERLDALERALRLVVADAASAAPSSIELDVQPIGRRPSGATAPDGELARAAVTATRFFGHDPDLALSSTDANIPMEIGIPAITLGCGGEAGKAHTTDEWYRDTGGVDGVLRALYTVLLVTGVT